MVREVEFLKIDFDYFENLGVGIDRTNYKL